MHTILWVVKMNVDNLPTYPQIVKAASLLKEGETIAFPTETVYGLGANALDGQAVAKIFKAKGRPTDNPLIVHIANQDQVTNLVQSIPSVALPLMEHFWPGPLTLIFAKKEAVFPDEVTAGLNTVAIRMPDHPVALALLKAAAVPVAAPSANRSGKPSPTTAQHVLEDLDGRIAGILDGGATGVGLESTVLDCTGAVPLILRPGGVTREQLEQVIGPVEIDRGLQHESETPRAPGMKYTHYAPKAPYILVDGTPDYLQTFVNEKKSRGLKVGVYTVDERLDAYDADCVIAGGSEQDLSTVAEKMYSVLRDFDQQGVDVIIGEVFVEKGIGAAIMNRLKKAAGGHIIQSKA